MEIDHINPQEMGRPLGLYSHVTKVSGADLVFMSGQMATDADDGLVGADDFEVQMEQVFRNVDSALRCAGTTLPRVVGQSGGLRLWFVPLSIYAGNLARLAVKSIYDPANLFRLNDNIKASS